MKWKLGFALMALIIASGCNLQRVLDPSLPTWTPAPAGPAGSTPTAADAAQGTPVDVGARIEAADLAFFYGDWDTALAEYEKAVESGEDDETRSAGLLGVGRTYHAMGRTLNAREILRTHLDLFPESASRANVQYALAQVYEELGNYRGAAEAYQAYLDLRPGLIDSLVQEFRGNALAAAGEHLAAIQAYQAAAATPRLSGVEQLNINIGDAYFQLADYQSAIVAYQNVLTTSNNDYTLAQMDLSIGRAHVALGQPEQAYPLYLHAVENYPLSNAAYAALIELVEAGIPVDELDRGLVDYYAAGSFGFGCDNQEANEVYSAAIAAFDRYLLQNPEEGADTAHYFRALALSAICDYPAAIRDFDAVINDHAFTPNWVEAFSQKAFIQWFYLDNYDAAIETLLRFVAATPSQGRSPEFLFNAARIAERGGQLRRSAELWERVGNEYPTSEYAYNAFFLAGISHFRLEDAGEAMRLFSRAEEGAPSLEDQSQALYWIGKLQEGAGDEDAARAAWEQAAAADPTGYYSERSRDRLAGVAPFTPLESYSLDYDVEAERAEAEAWMRTIFELPAGTELSGPGALAEDARFLRGMEMWNLGEYGAARVQFEDLRASIQDSPADNYRLANALIEIGLYRPAIFAARQVLTLAGMNDAETMQAPAYFNRIRFGPYYRSLVENEARASGFDPLFLLSTMRQESLFEGFVTSSAGARGLMQIVPATGAEIATLEGWPLDYSAEDLYRPQVSIRFGAGYLARQRNAFGGDLYQTLAAYNAGPGNALRWANTAGDDMDLFLEVINFSETRGHIKGIYEIFTIYRNLYGE